MPNGCFETLVGIRFAINVTPCSSTAQALAYLTIARELWRTDGVTNDLRSVIDAENYVAKITLYLKRFATVLKKSRELEKQQDFWKEQID